MVVIILKLKKNESTTTSATTTESTTTSATTTSITTSTTTSETTTPTTTQNAVKPETTVTPSYENGKANIFTDSYLANKLKINHPEFKISKDLQNRFNATLSKYSNSTGLYVISQDGSISFGYNPDIVKFAASTVKAPYCMYLLKEVDKGNASLDTILTYNNGMYNGGGGIIQFSEYGSQYSVKRLVELATTISDNIAYNMLRNNYGKTNYDKMIISFGCKNSTFAKSNNSGWINSTPRDMVLIWQQLYKYSNESQNGKLLFDYLKISEGSCFPQSIPNIESARKYGYTSSVYNNTGMVLGNYPYFVSVFGPSNIEYCTEVLLLCNEVMVEYQEYVTKHFL